MLGITHFAKGSAGQDPVERVIGSTAFGALPRIVWAAAKTHETSDSAMPRVCVRTNIGPSGGGVGYDIVGKVLPKYSEIYATSISWLGAIEGTAGELLAEAGEQKSGAGTKTEAAKAFLRSQGVS